MHVEIKANVDILGVKEESWGAEVIARIVDTGSLGMTQQNAGELAVEAASLAYRQKFDLPDEKYHSTKAEVVMPSTVEEKTWYAHLKVFKWMR